MYKNIKRLFSKKLILLFFLSLTLINAFTLILKNYEDDYTRIVLSFNQSIATYL